MKSNSFWNEETAHLTYRREGRFLIIEERPLWAIAAEKIGGMLSGDLTRHWFCCHPPKWVHNIRWGKLDEDGFTEKSLGHLMFMAGQSMAGGWGAWRQTRRIAEIPVSVEWIREHYPELDDWPWIKDDVDE